MCVFHACFCFFVRAKPLVLQPAQHMEMQMLRMMEALTWVEEFRKLVLLVVESLRLRQRRGSGRNEGLTCQQCARGKELLSLLR